MEEQIKTRPHAQGARWRRLDNTAKLFAAVAGEDLSNVFRISVILKEEVHPEFLERALAETLDEFESFRVRLRKGFFWKYFETNNKEALVEKENLYPCKYIDPHGSHQYLFRVSYFRKRINFEVFHALTDGMGAVNFVKSLTKNYLKESGKLTKEECAGPNIPEKNAEAQNRDFERKEEDGYLKHYKKQIYRQYTKERAIQPTGKILPLDSQNVLHGYASISDLKRLCKEKNVSMTKYLTALLIWSLIQVYTDGTTLKHSAALNLPINLRNFFDSDTMANFFAVTNIAWQAGKKPENFDEVLQSVSRQMDEKIVKERLEEIISYNVSNEKKWYVRLVPLWLKQLAASLIFLKTCRAYTMTLSNLGIFQPEPEVQEQIDRCELILGVSKKQELKCGVIAFGEEVCITFNSIFEDQKLAEYFFGFLKEKGVRMHFESNGLAGEAYCSKSYPKISYDRDKLKKIGNLFCLILFTAAVLTGIVNYVTYDMSQTWWSVITISSIAYAGVTLRYSVMRRSSISGIILMESVGGQILLGIIDYITGFHGWAFNYAIPSILLFDVIAIMGLMVVNRLNWQSYFMYQLVITIFSFIPLVLWLAGLITKPLMSWITVILSVMCLVITILLGDRSVKKELKRRFHF